MLCGCSDFKYKVESTATFILSSPLPHSSCHDRGQWPLVNWPSSSCHQSVKFDFKDSRFKAAFPGQLGGAAQVAWVGVMKISIKSVRLTGGDIPSIAFFHVWSELTGHWTTATLLLIIMDACIIVVIFILMLFCHFFVNQLAIEEALFPWQEINDTK